MTLEQQAASYAALIMEEMDPDHHGYIEVNTSLYMHVSFQLLLHLHCHVFHLLQMWQLESLLGEMLSTEGCNMPLKKSQTLMRTMIPKRYRTPFCKYFTLSGEFIHENWKKIWVVTLWLYINFCLFNWKYREYKKRGAYQIMGQCLCFAKGAAETLKFNMALILFPVCRRTLTKLRSTFLSNVIPFDENINFHKLIALAVAIGTFIHVGMHITCDFPRLTSCPDDKFTRILGNNFDYKQPTYLDLVQSTPGVTGVLMVILMAFTFTLALHSFRKNAIKLPWPFHHLAGFNSFWYAHHLLILVYILLVIHGYCLFLTKEWYKKTVIFLWFFEQEFNPSRLIISSRIIVLCMNTAKKHRRPFFSF